MQLIHTVLICASAIGTVRTLDRENAWNLRISDSTRDGRFLNVPIYYGDWVPITRAKQTIEAVASKIEAATKNLRRVDPPPEIITAPLDPPSDRVDNAPKNIVPYEPSSHYSHWSQPSHQSHWRPPKPQRPPRRRVDHTRNHRNHRKLAGHQKPIFNIFNHQQVPTEKPTEEPTTQSSLLGNVFNFFNPLLNQNHKPDIILHDSPVIKTLPAPDLTKVNEISLFATIH